MTEDLDPVDAVILAFLDHLESAVPRPALDHLTGANRLRAENLIDSLVAGRGIDPHAVRPSVEALLVDTPLAGLIPALGRSLGVAGSGAAFGDAGGGAGLAAVRRVLAGVDARARVDIDATGSPCPTVIYSYLDVRARFVVLPDASPAITEDVRGLVQALFAADPDTSRIGVVAVGSDELVTQVLAAEAVAATITTPRGDPYLRWDPPLPLALAARRMLEQIAPEWPRFDFDHASTGAFDAPAVAAEIAAQIIDFESTRPYRGEKRRAYRALLGAEGAFADLVAHIGHHGADLDLEAEITRISQAAA